RQAGAELVAFDPAIRADDSSFDGDLLTVVDDPYVAAKDVDAIVILTEWPEFRGLDWRRLATVVKNPLVFDTRNLVDPDGLRRAGFSWSALGRPPRLVAAPPRRAAAAGGPGG